MHKRYVYSSVIDRMKFFRSCIFRRKIFVTPRSFEEKRVHDQHQRIFNVVFWKRKTRLSKIIGFIAAYYRCLIFTIFYHSIYVGIGNIADPVINRLHEWLRVR